MKQYDIDGVIVQRFLVNLGDPSFGVATQLSDATAP